MEKLNRVNMRLLLSALEPTREDIVVTKTEGVGENKKNADGITVGKTTTWAVKNKKGREIFSLKHENVEYDEKRFVRRGVRAILKIGTFYVVFYSKCSVSDAERFVFYDLPAALANKMSAQKKEKKLQQDWKNMSPMDVAIKTYLENMLQK